MIIVTFVTLDECHFCSFVCFDDVITFLESDQARRLWQSITTSIVTRAKKAVHRKRQAGSGGESNQNLVTNNVLSSCNF